MSFLHPVFTIITIILVVYSFMEAYNDKKYKSLWIVVFLMILLIGFRRAGADYPIYMKLYEYTSSNTLYKDIWGKASFGNTDLEFEWAYILIGKITYDLSQPFFIFTFILALLAISLKYLTLKENVAYPSLAVLLYMFPGYFSAEGGHMRQGMAIAFTIFSFFFIKKRKLLGFLFMMYLAIGFHNSAIIFIFAYWLVLIPLNSTRIILLVVLSIILSPFKVYEFISILDSIKEVDIYQGFQAHQQAAANSGRISFTDLICVMNLYYIVTFDKEACKKIIYYEYMRNLNVIGICLYFIFRENVVFSSRLVAYYLTIMIMVYPNIIAAVENINTKRILHLAVVGFGIFYYFVYAKMQAPGVSYDIKYNNYLFFWQ